MKKGWFIKSKGGRWMMNILKGATLTSVLFIVQACYGTTPGGRTEKTVMLQGKVVSATTGEPIKGIRVDLLYSSESSYTDENGMFVIYTWETNDATLLYKDIDGDKNGSYVGGSMNIGLMSDRFVDITMNEK